MTEDDQSPPEFDMYRFFSRWDVLLAALVVLLLVIYAVVHGFGHGAAA